MMVAGTTTRRKGVRPFTSWRARIHRRQTRTLNQALIAAAIAPIVSFCVMTGCWFTGVAVLGEGVLNVNTPTELHDPSLDPFAQADADRLMAQYDCTTGVVRGEVSRVIVQDVDGSVRATSFDEAWAMFYSNQPFTLLAKCAA